MSELHTALYFLLLASVYAAPDMPPGGRRAFAGIFLGVATVCMLVRHFGGGS